MSDWDDEFGGDAYDQEIERYDEVEINPSCECICKICLLANSCNFHKNGAVGCTVFYKSHR
jgi:hypothetical protein